MSGNENVDRERVNRLMMAALDGEISTDERADLDRVLERHAFVVLVFYRGFW